MKNEYEIRGDITAIYLNSPTHGNMETIISTERLHRVSEFPNTWYVHKVSGNFYACGNYNTPNLRTTSYGMHQWIMGIHKGKVVDHRNLNSLDNTDKNLRIITHAENAQNIKVPSNSSSGIIGVHWHKGCGLWNVRLNLKGKRINFGYFKDIEEAKKVSVQARMEHMPFSAG